MRRYGDSVAVDTSHDTPFRSLQSSRQESMKTPPDSPEFARFTGAMRDILKVSKIEMNRRIEAEKRKPKASASRVSGASSKQAD